MAPDVWTKAYTPPVPGWTLNFVWLDITRRCQLKCVHCMVGASPDGDHGSMTTAGWLRVIDELAQLGVREVQFIGGEPTLHPDLPEFIEHALELGLNVEVFSNLVHVSATLWDLFGRPGVSLAASYYTSDRAQHKVITGGYDTLRQTTANIAKACALGIPIRIGGIAILDGQDVAGAISQLLALGVPEVGAFDVLRSVGRGDPTGSTTLDTSQLCGRCTAGVLAISPDGNVAPCMFSGSLPAGNVLTTSLSDIISGPRLAGVLGGLDDGFLQRREEELTGDSSEDGLTMKCVPHGGRQTCIPSLTCSPTCKPSLPCGPTKSCNPNCKPFN